MNSIRLRALFGAVLAAWAIFAVLAVVDHRTIRDLLVYHFDDELRTHAGALVSLVHRDGDRLVLHFDEQVLPFYRSGANAEYFEVWDSSARVMRRSESLGDQDLPAEWGTPEQPRIADVRLPDGRPGRAIGVRYVRGEHSIGIAVAEPRQLLDDALAALVASSAWTAAGLGGALAALLWFVLRAGLRPLQELSARVARLNVGHLPERVGMGTVPREIAPVVARLEELLGRVRALIDRERRVTSNIAHELMTPLAELRALTDVAIRFPEDTDYQRRATTATNETTIRLQAIAEKVLALATAESGAVALVRISTDVAAMLREVVALSRLLGEQRAVTMLVQAPDSLVVETDPVAVRVVLDNLVQNAAEHAPCGSGVRVTLDAQEGLVLTVSNSAPELTAEDVAQLTEPYWRKDAARSSGTSHAGIGLALASELAERLGGRLALHLDQGVLTVALQLPATGGGGSSATEALPPESAVDTTAVRTSGGAREVGWRHHFAFLQQLACLRVSDPGVRRFLQFALVGASGVAVDMAVLYLLSDPQTLALGLTRSKLVAAELAILNNFLWNDAWTFRDLVGAQRGPTSKLRRFVEFNVVCGIGLILNVVLLNVMFNLLQMNRYLANLVAIALVTLWNFRANLELRGRGADTRPAK